MSDLIEREKAIDALKAEVRLIDGYCCVDDRVIDESDAIEAINSIPPAQPEQKVGKWIVMDDDRISGRCSVCGWEAHLYEDDAVGMDYCPNCGAKMEE